MSSTMTITKKKTKRAGQVLTLTVDPPATTTGLQTPPATPVESAAAIGSGQESPIAVVLGGTPYTTTDIANMGRVLSRARAENEFPTTRTPDYNVQAMADDYYRLTQLRQLRGETARSEWNRNQTAVEYYVNIVREIRERDETLGEEAAAASVEARVAGMMNGVQAESALYNLIRHAVHSVVQNGGAQQTADNTGVDITGVLRDVEQHLNNLTTSQDGMSAIMAQIRNTIQGRISQENPELSGVDMESVFEEVFAVIERSLLDATGPLRLNINRMNGQINNMDNIANNVSDIADVQLNAIGQHVNAIDNHVHAMGNNLGSMGTLVNSTNNNITAMSAQVNLLQTIVNMLPQMIVQAVQEVLPGIVHETVGSAVGNAITNDLVGNLHNFVGIMNQARSQAASSGKSTSGSNEKGQTGNKKNRKNGGFMSKFFGIFKKNGRDDGAGSGGSGPGMAA